MELRLRREALEWRETDGEILALDVAGAEYLALNGAAALLWRGLADGATREELASTLVGEFGIDREAAGSDVDRFVERLGARGLLA